MQKLMIATGLFFASAAACASDGAQWGYAGAEGPGHWGELSQKFSACSMGKNQSPIDLSSFIESDLKPIGIHYQTGGNEILNNGHSVQVNYAPGSKIFVDGHEFTLKQYHFHSPSENHINGKSYPMEAHLVHADQDGNLAVIAVMFEQGEESKALAQAWAQMPEKAGDSHSLSSSVAAEDILPSSRDYYRYNGSLTTPPCSEGVEWLVMKEPVSASKAQIEKFAQVMRHPNNRPIQVVGARPVLQ